MCVCDTCRLLEVRDALGESLAKSEGLAADLEHFKKQALTDETGNKEKIKALVQVALQVFFILLLLCI